MQVAAQNRLRLTKDLRGALRADEFEVHFQPIIDLNNDRICKAEALVRWRHPKRGVVGPAEFIPLAEDTGLIYEIGDRVVWEAARRSRRWSEMFDKDFQVSVNMSPVQFRVEDDVFVRAWLKCLEGHSLNGTNIVVEITERLLLNVESEVINKLLWLRDSGVQVAVDDFGTGYSSLSYLREFDIDYLKIDKTFVHNLGLKTNAIALSEAIIVMAHKLGLKVIAEGVETEVQTTLLKNADCDYVQGYLYSRPVPPEDVEVLLLRQKTKELQISGALN